MRLKIYSSLGLSTILLLLISIDLQASQPDAGKNKATLKHDIQILEAREQELLLQQQDAERRHQQAQTAAQEKIDAEYKKRKDQKKAYNARTGHSFQTTHAAPVAGTETDAAQAEYFKAQAASLKRGDYGGIAAQVSRDYVAPTIQPVLTEGRQMLYKTKHEACSEQKDELEVELSKENVNSHKASTLNTEVNTLIALYQMASAKEEKERIKKLIEKKTEEIERQLGISSKDTTSSTETPSEEKPSEQNNDTQQNPKEENTASKVNKGFIAKLGAILCPPILAQGIDAVAQACGAQTVAQWLTAQSPLLTGKETAISRTLTATGVAVVCVALYKAYQIFSSEEDDDEDGLDIFSEDFNVNNNR